MQRRKFSLKWSVKISKKPGRYKIGGVKRGKEKISLKWSVNISKKPGWYKIGGVKKGGGDGN